MNFRSGALVGWLAGWWLVAGWLLAGWLSGDAQAGGIASRNIRIWGRVPGASCPHNHFPCNNNLSGTNHTPCVKQDAKSTNTQMGTFLFCFRKTVFLQQAHKLANNKFPTSFQNSRTSFTTKLRKGLRMKTEPFANSCRTSCGANTHQNNKF